MEILNKKHNLNKKGRKKS